MVWLDGVLTLVIVYSYFSQTAHLLDKDSSLYCISAWNDFVSNSVMYLKLNMRWILGEAEGM